MTQDGESKEHKERGTRHDKKLHNLHLSENVTKEIKS
jgi:hypothetical protein